jgi:lysophospholipase L1-like esterase
MKRSDVDLMDLHGRLCASGFTESIDGIKLRTDGLHFSPAGARFVWQWLAPQLESSALASTVPPAR